MAQVDLKYAAKGIDLAHAKVRRAVARGLLAACFKGVQIIQTQIIPSRHPQPVDRGIYRAGWKARSVKRGDKLIGGEIYNAEPEAALIELGVRAANVKIGRAMIQALAEWAHRKGMDLRWQQTSAKVRLNRKTGKYVQTAAKVRYGASDAAAVQVAWAIAKAMKRRGIFGPVGLRVLHELMEQRMPEIADAEIKRALAGDGGTTGG